MKTKVYYVTIEKGERGILWGRLLYKNNLIVTCSTRKEQIMLDILRLMKEEGYPKHGFILKAHDDITLEKDSCPSKEPPPAPPGLKNVLYNGIWSQQIDPSYDPEKHKSHDEFS